MLAILCNINYVGLNDLKKSYTKFKSASRMKISIKNICGSVKCAMVRTKARQQ